MNALESAAFRRILCWLEKHAPRMRAALLPPPPSAELDALAASLQCEVPEGIARLYAACGGQTGDAPDGLFRGYTMLPLHGVDGLETAWPAMLDAFEAGAAWATKDRYPFATDFGGSWFCVDTGTESGEPGTVIEIEDGDVTVLAKDMETFLEKMATELETGATAIDDTVEELEPFEIVFDASRQRAPGDAVTHSVFTSLGIEATVEALEAQASAVEKHPHGLAVRMVARANDVKVGTVRLEDGRRRAFGRAGHGSGGGRPGFFVFATSASPLPAGSRLFVTLQKSRRV